ncbi:uncharacterized protein JCM15063_005873 [Sporobolomyces koalae]|uniref:uncharacterized protein n=1 Tax=Sporobolomyces koalae TaxID=500713 RepID=UPI00316CB787
MDATETPPPPAIEPVKKSYVEPFVIAASSASAISARLCTHPLDTVRIRIQTAGAIIPPLKQLVPAPRLRNLYAGLPVAIGFSVPALSVYMLTYETTKRYIAENFISKHEKPTLLQQLPIFVAAGTAAELASGAIWTPLDVLKSRLQKGNEGTSAIALSRKIVQEEGIKGLFRGYMLGNFLYVPNISVYWMTYESLKTRFIPGYSSLDPKASTTSKEPLEGIPLTARFTLCSIASCCAAACTTNPIEVVQARWQTSGGKAAGGIMGIVKELYQQGGAKAFSRGLGVRIAYAIPANGISMTVYESLKRWKGI